MHIIHHTSGFILNSRNVREADKVFYIYTRDFGLVVALAKAVRKLSSKLRYNLQDFYYVNLDLVRGREVWRVTNAERVRPPGDSPYLMGGTVPANASAFPDPIMHNQSVFLFLSNFFRLIRRLVPGEDPNPNLFQHLVDVYKFIRENQLRQPADDPREFASFECLAVLRLLHHLGYIALDKNMSIFVTSILDKKVLSEAAGQHVSLIRQINDSLKETQL